VRQRRLQLEEALELVQQRVGVSGGEEALIIFLKPLGKKREKERGQERETEIERESMTHPPVVCINDLSEPWSTSNKAYHGQVMKVRLFSRREKGRGEAGRLTIISFLSFPISSIQIHSILPGISLQHLRD
jgi:hypothetical protein